MAEKEAQSSLEASQRAAMSGDDASKLGDFEKNEMISLTSIKDVTG